MRYGTFQHHVHRLLGRHSHQCAHYRFLRSSMTVDDAGFENRQTLDINSRHDVCTPVVISTPFFTLSAMLKGVPAKSVFFKDPFPPDVVWAIKDSHENVTGIANEHIVGLDV